MTPDDPRVEPPEAKPTTKLEAVPPWAIELTQAMKSGIAEVRADVALVSNDLGLLKTRVSIMESLRVEDEARVVKLSGGVRGLSNADMGHESKLANVIIETEHLKTAIVETHALASRAAATLQEQSDFMGVGKRGLQWLSSKEGRNALAQLGAAVVVVYEALKHVGAIK